MSASVSGKGKVVLSGEGGDELFGGYHRYFWDRFALRLSEAPWTVRIVAAMAAAVVPHKSLRQRSAKFMRSLPLNRAERFFSWFSIFGPDENPWRVGNDKVASSLTNVMGKVFVAAKPLSETAQAQWVDLVTFLRDDLLPKADKASMAHSIEVRVPFLQAQVVEAAFSVPDRNRVRGRVSKPVLREMLRGYLPREIVERKKQGFSLPMDRWFRGPLEPLVTRYLSRERIERFGLLNSEVTSKIWMEHKSGKANRGLALYAMVLFGAWCEEFL